MKRGTAKRSPLFFIVYQATYFKLQVFNTSEVHGMSFLSRHSSLLPQLHVLHLLAASSLKLFAGKGRSLFQSPLGAIRGSVKIVKSDLLQRVIDDVQSEAANAAEMKAAASGNPLILMQVKLASDLRKLEALYAQHQRGQHRLRDRLKWLATSPDRLQKAEADYAENIRRRDLNTRYVTEKGQRKQMLELLVDGRILTDKHSEEIKNHLLSGIKETSRDSCAKVAFDNYRSFDELITRHSAMGSGDGFCFIMKGAGNREFQPGNLIYSFEDKLSLSGLFQRMDNFLNTGLEKYIENQRQDAKLEQEELETVNLALGKEFPQKEELVLARENHAAVIRELQRMQEDSSYVSERKPKTAGPKKTEQRMDI